MHEVSDRQYVIINANVNNTGNGPTFESLIKTLDLKNSFRHEVKNSSLWFSK